MLQLSVIIVSYNVRHYLHQCLSSVEQAAANIEHEIFVVDNNSSDGSIEFLQPLHPAVRYIWNKENVGFARANNQAIAKARGKYILLLNPDTIVTEHTLTDCIELMESRPDAGALGVRMLNADGTFAPESRRSIPTPFTAFCKMSGLGRLFPQSRTFGRYYMQYLDARHVNEIEVVSGAFFFTRRSTLKQSGTLDEDFFMYGEDIDLSYRILQTGLHNLYLPTPILHYKGESTHESTYRYVRTFYEAMLIFIRKHFSHYNLVVSLPIKAAIFLKGIFSYFNLQLNKNFDNDRATLRQLQRNTYAYLTPDDAEGYEAVRTLLASNGITLQPYGTQDAELLVYNAERSSYAEMLQRLEHPANPKRRNWLVTWHPTTQALITSIRVLVPLPERG